MKYLLFILIFSFFFCKPKQTAPIDPSKSMQSDSLELAEYFQYIFIDSITQKHIYTTFKFTLSKYQDISIDTLYIESALYKKEHNEWKLLQSEQEETCLLTSIDTDLIDLNDDGFMDLLYTSGAAARGVNRVNSCIIYKPKEERYIRLHNATDYPSISYNEKLKCIDSQAIYGGSTTSFLNIQRDSLFCFAEISLFGNERYFYLPDGTLQDTLGTPTLSYFRFSDYRLKEALKEYEEAKIELDSSI